MQHWRLASFYFMYFALIGAIMPYWALYLTDQGYSPVEIGLLGSILMGTKIVSPYLSGWLSDKTGRPVKVIRWSASLSLLCFSAIFITDGFLSLALVIASFSFFWNGQIGQFEAITLSRLSNRPSLYGGIRAWGSIGFIVTVVLLGMLFNHLQINLLPVFMMALLLGVLVSSFLVKDTKTALAPQKGLGFFKQVRQPAVICFFFICLMLQLSHGPYYTFYSIFLDDLGYSKGFIGWLWAISVIAELLLFLSMFWVQKYFSLKSIICFSLAMSAVRWLLIAFMPDSLMCLVIAQILHAFSFASFHGAAVQWVSQLFDRGCQGQGQALYSTMGFGAGGSLGAFLSGYIWAVDPFMTWIFAFIASVIALCFSFLLKSH